MKFNILLAFILLSGIVFADDLDGYMPCGGDAQFIADCYGEDYINNIPSLFKILGKGVFDWLTWIMLGGIIIGSIIA